MKVVSIIIVALLIGCTPKSKELEYTQNEIAFAPFAKLQIVPTFEKPIAYELTQHGPYLLLYSEYEGQGGYNWGNIATIKKINLSEEQYIEATKLLRECLTSLPQNDDAFGPDGATWILEATAYQYLKTSIWEPEDEAEKRGYSKLIELRAYLHKLVIESSN